MQVLGTLRLAGEDVDGDALVVEAELPQEDAHLEAVRGRAVVEERQHRRPQRAERSGV